MKSPLRVGYYPEDQPNNQTVTFFEGLDVLLMGADMGPDGSGVGVLTGKEESTRTVSRCTGYNKQFTPIDDYSLYEPDAYGHWQGAFGRLYTNAVDTLEWSFYNTPDMVYDFQFTSPYNSRGFAGIYSVDVYETALLFESLTANFDASVFVLITFIWFLLIALYRLVDDCEM
jgi:hypothetical protein